MRQTLDKLGSNAAKKVSPQSAGTVVEMRCNVKQPLPRSRWTSPVAGEDGGGMRRADGLRIPAAPAFRSPQAP